MGTFVFKWEHPASEVYVTGTFDGWSKSEKLEKIGDAFEKNVTLSSADKKIYYKFVVDGNWVTDPTAPQENDASGNLNNVLTTDRITKHRQETGIMSGVTPTSTTADLAKDVPLEKSSTSSGLPGSFPETPAAVDKADFSVNPLPATEGAVNPIKLAPGEKVPDPSSFTNNTLTSGVHDDPELVEKLKQQEIEKEGEQTIGISPLPAFPGAVNPIKVAPGAESADAGPTIQSAGPGSTTATLAAGVSLESSKVPGIVKESQEAAGVEPEASAIAKEVKEKNAVEKELESKVPELPPTSEGIAGQGTTKSEYAVTAGEAAAAVGGAFVALGGAAAVATSGLVSKIPNSVTSKLPLGVQESINNLNAESDSRVAAAKEAPEIVKESIVESGQAPEAASNPEAISEKKEVEKELLGEVKKETSTGEPAPKITETPSKKLETPVVASEPESRDVSPGTIPGSRVQTHQEPTVTTGVGSGPAAEKSSPKDATKPFEPVSTPSKVTASSSKPTESPASASVSAKKKNRASAFFSKLKHKLSDK